MDENEGDDYTIFDNNKKLRYELKKLNDNLNSLFNSKNPSNTSLIILYNFSGVNIKENEMQ